MRRMLLALLPLAVLSAPAAAGVGPFEANDTGGIIAWSPDAQRHARQIVRAHCAQYGKVGEITSVNARYGTYIAFACRFPRGYHARHHRRAVVVRARY